MVVAAPTNVMNYHKRVGYVMRRASTAAKYPPNAVAMESGIASMRPATAYVATDTSDRMAEMTFFSPRFARRPIPHDHIGIYRYLGGGEWHTVPRVQRPTFFNIGF